MPNLKRKSSTAWYNITLQSSNYIPTFSITVCTPLKLQAEVFGDCLSKNLQINRTCQNLYTYQVTSWNFLRFWIRWKLINWKNSLGFENCSKGVTARGIPFDWFRFCWTKFKIEQNLHQSQVTPLAVTPLVTFSSLRLKAENNLFKRWKVRTIFGRDYFSNSLLEAF